MTNLLLVLADQWRGSALGASGTDPVHTPVLDAFATEARVLTEAVSTHPVCSPCRAMLLSGQYPSRTGVTGNLHSHSAARPVDGVPYFSDVLAARGYRLGYIGKWHLYRATDADAGRGEGRRADGRVWDAFVPPDQRHGFDFWHAHNCCDDHLHPHYWTGADETPTTVDRWSPEHETDVAIRFLQNAARGAEPFALVVSYNPPHPPFDQLPARLLARYADVPAATLLGRPNVADPRRYEWAARRYFAALTGVDEQLGRLLAALAETGAASDTVVVFTADHGMQLGSHDLLAKNVAYEESMRVPFLIGWPGRIPAGTDDLLLGSPDVAPTLLALLGAAAAIPAATQGRDLSGPLLDPAAGSPRPRAQLYLGPDDDRRGVRTHDRKLLATRAPDGSVRHTLFDRVLDPYERTDVAADRPREVRRLTRLLRAELDRADDPWPGSTALVPPR